MARVIFYDKPGCAGAARRQAMLVAAGHAVEARDLFAESWNAPALRPFFGAKPVREWFSSASPRIMSGEIDVENITPQQALVMMLVDPTLIRRPLMRVGDHCEAGFDANALRSLVALRTDDKTDAAA
jgi:nitrogenase-associated protein